VLFNCSKSSTCRHHTAGIAQQFGEQTVRQYVSEWGRFASKSIIYKIKFATQHSLQFIKNRSDVTERSGTVHVKWTACLCDVCSCSFVVNWSIVQHNNKTLIFYHLKMNLIITVRIHYTVTIIGTFLKCPKIIFFWEITNAGTRSTT